MNSVSSCSDDSDCIILVNKDEREKVATANLEKCHNSEPVEEPSIKITDCPPVSISVIEVQDDSILILDHDEKSNFIPKTTREHGATERQDILISEAADGGTELGRDQN